MRQKMRWLAVAAGLLVLAGSARAQQRIGSSGSSFTGSSGGGFTGSSGGGFTGSSGSSGGGFTGSSGGGFTGSSGSSGGFSGSSGGFSGSSSSGSFSGGSGFAGSTGMGGRSLSGTGSYGQTSVIGRFYGNPLAAGYAAGSSGSTSGSSIATQGIRSFPQTLSFGQPINQAAVSRTTQMGTSAGQGQIGGQAASSAGTRRAPPYLTEPTFARREMGQQQQPQQSLPQPTLNTPAPTPAVTLRAEDLQAVITRSDRLPSRENIAVSMDNDGVVVLRGNVGSERERRLAEATMRLSPGVREVRNELVRSRR